MSDPMTLKPAAWMCPECKARFVKVAPHLAPRMCCARTHRHNDEPVLVREPLFTRDDLVRVAMEMAGRLECYDEEFIEGVVTKMLGEVEK